MKNPVLKEAIDQDIIQLEAAPGLDVDIDEMVIRTWFKWVSIEQAEDTMRVLEGIIEGRRAAEPKRKRRKDAGAPRTSQPTLLKADD